MGKFHLKLCLALAFLSVALCQDADSPDSGISDGNNQQPPPQSIPVYCFLTHTEQGVIARFTLLHNMEGEQVGVLSSGRFIPGDRALPNEIVYPNYNIIQRLIGGAQTTQRLDGEPELSAFYTPGEVVNP